MTGHAFAALCLTLTALFEVDVIPLENPSARIFPAPLVQGEDAALAVLDGHRLSLYSPSFETSSAHVTLEPGTSAFDIADVDGDGRSEVTAVCGPRILVHSLPPKGTSATRELFTAQTLLADPLAGPFPHVIVVPVGKEIALALPHAESLKMYRADGTLLIEIPLAPRGPNTASYGSPFLAWPVDPPQTGGEQAIETRLSVVREFHVSPPEELRGLFPPESPGLNDVEQSFRRGTPTQMREAGANEPENWPWFPLRTRRDGTERALYALAGPDHRSTLIRIREAHEAAKNQGIKIGPARKYPGTLVLLPERLPDFNGDGYTDLLLWSAPDPGSSLDSLSRALVGGDWPLRIRIHLFSPLKNRYEPACSGVLSLRIPLAWFLVKNAGLPLRNCVLEDFNGDGKTDLACSVSPKRFSVWLYADGLAAKPDFTQEFRESVSSVDLREDLSGAGRTSLVLRGSKSLYFLRATGE
jgi:hypothetical protein